ncbi:MAG: hypothetical protein B6I20_09775 [Bacteroidetes bacterium 4572_117]|nr:MAG: hypothetical protein B6I20_09775 [Bacteroidetes bacterium 4572_117]
MIDNYKTQLEAYFNKWRKINLEKKEEKKSLLYKIDEVASFLEDSDSVFVAKFYMKIAYFIPAEEYKIAEKYFLKVIKQEKVFKNHVNILEAAYEGLGDLYFEQKLYDKAADAYIKLLEVVEIINFLDEDILQMGIAMLNHSKNSHTEKAEKIIEYIYKLDLCHKDMDHELFTQTTFNLGLAKYKLKKYTEAKPYFKKAIILYQQQKWDCEKIHQYLNSIANHTDSKPMSVSGM